jgi:3-oxoadipate enol-lactonase
VEVRRERTLQEENMTDKSQSQAGMASVNGTYLYYEIAGSGRSLVFLHAGIADSRMWDEQFWMLAPTHRVLRYDLRGFGISAPASGTFSHRQDLCSLLDFLQIGKASLVGLSLGGQLALDFALEWPDRVESLILMAALPSGSVPTADLEQVWEAEEAALQAGSIAEANEIVLRAWVDGPHRTPDQVAPLIRQHVRTMNAVALAHKMVQTAYALQPLQPPAIERLEAISIPTLILVGDLDRSAFLTEAEKLATKIPGAQLIVFPGVAHMVNLEQPNEFYEVVTKFLGSFS